MPEGIATDWHFTPRGTMTARRSDDRVDVYLGDLNIVCKPDMTRQFTLEDKQSDSEDQRCRRAGTLLRGRHMLRPNSAGGAPTRSLSTA